MAGFGMDFFQNQQMTQQMHLSPQMQQSLSFLMMSHYELTENIYQAMDLNPALELIHDPKIEVKNYSVLKKNLPKELKTSTRAEIQQQKSDAFQNFLENQEDETQTIQQYLWKQFCLTTSEPEELCLGEKLISNLDYRGFTQIHPHSLLDNQNSTEDIQLLEKCLITLQNLEPIGCCTSGSEESLYVQAFSKIQDLDTEGPFQKFFFGKETSNLVLFFLAGNLSMLERPRYPLIIKTIKKMQSSIELANQAHATIAWTLPPQPIQLPNKITETMVENAIKFIQTLDPLPARQFSSHQNNYIYPEVVVEQVEQEEEREFNIYLNNSLIPSVGISPVYKKAQEQANTLSSEEKKMVKKSVKNAQDIIQSLVFRENTIYKATEAIVEFQRDFFLQGPRFLHPLRMKDVAEKVGVHEATISRMANGKYLRCQWGIFEIKYFFSNHIATIKPSLQQSPTSKQNLGSQSTIYEPTLIVNQDISSHQGQILPEDRTISKEGVKFILKDLLEKHQQQNPGAKPLSDQKVSDLLAQQGIKIARRTVAKYRSELNIDSSFDRK